jgi:hypothetical protein
MNSRGIDPLRAPGTRDCKSPCPSKVLPLLHQWKGSSRETPRAERRRTAMCRRVHAAKSLAPPPTTLTAETYLSTNVGGEEDDAEGVVVVGERWHGWGG